MWSDRLATASRKALVEQLRQVLSAPRGGAAAESTELSWDAEPAAVAEALWPDSDFLWLDQPPECTLFAGAIARLSVAGDDATVRGPGGTIRLKARGFDLVEAALEAWGGAADARLCGYLGYELGSELEEVPQSERRTGDLPDLHLALYDWRLEYHSGHWRLCGTNAWRTSDGLALTDPKFKPRRSAALNPGPVSATSSEHFCGSVARTVSRIHNGELFQANLCRRLEAALPADQVWPVYLRLRQLSPASQGALIRTSATGAVLSVSPELFLSVRNGQVRSSPIKGTRPRGTTPEEDRALANALSQSEKDRAELAMIVDVTRNDLGRVCRPGSVRVERHAMLCSLPTVHHTYSVVSGELRSGYGPVDLLRASFPPASITGAPKIHAMEVAAVEEGFRRGPAMGSIGWISLGGDMELSVAIRTAIASEGRIWYLAGCGITADSVPEEELAESEAKAVAFRGALTGSPVATVHPHSALPKLV